MNFFTGQCSPLFSVFTVSVSCSDFAEALIHLFTFRAVTPYFPVYKNDNSCIFRFTRKITITGCQVISFKDHFIYKRPFRTKTQETFRTRVLCTKWYLNFYLCDLDYEILMMWNLIHNYSAISAEKYSVESNEWWIPRSSASSEIC